MVSLLYPVKLFLFVFYYGGYKLSSKEKLTILLILLEFFTT